MKKKLDLEISTKQAYENQQIKELESKLVEAQLNLNKCELKRNTTQIEFGEMQVK